ncbi:hypothetical protein [Helicobacter cetorum]|uniref:hypothetical protein n=1 Tax=Helicobacter cetorum TaxID=138563 RepID=UPI00131531FE|nr:hypothetical protein [Helicobacter cetorum]
MTSYLSTKKTNLNPLKENLRYTTSQEFLSCGLDMTNSFKRICPIKPLMGRDAILQQNPLKLQNSVSLEVFDSFGGFLGIKILKILDSVSFISFWLQQYQDKNILQTIAFSYMNPGRPDFQNQNLIYIQNGDDSKKAHIKFFGLTLKTLLIGAIYFSVRYVFEHTWINHNDQFYAPYNDAWQSDDEFKNNALAFMLFHGKNRITTGGGGG